MDIPGKMLKIVTASVLFGVILLGCGGGQTQNPVLTAWPVVHVPPLTDDADNCDGQDQEAIQDALDLAPVQVVLESGAYCLNAPLIVHSHTRIEGAGDGRNGAPLTLLRQTRSATGVFHLKAVRNVAIRGLKIILPGQEDISRAAGDDDDCIRNPTSDKLCMWQRPSAIAAYDTRDIRITGTTLSGAGLAGIALLDQPILAAPTGGPKARLIPLENGGWAIRDDTCSEGDTHRNRDWVIEHNRIEGVREGILIYNLSDSFIHRNTLRNSQRYNGIKIGCGPVRDNHIIANYLHDNGQGGLGDGIDVAWAWTDPGPDSINPHYEDQPDGFFRGNLIEGNLAWNNLGNGFAIKIKKGGQGCQGYENEPLYQLGSNTLLRNASWDNGRGGSLRGDPLLATTSQLELRCIRPQGSDRLEVSGNLFAARLPILPGLTPLVTFPLPIAAAPITPRHGATLDRIRRADHSNNWHSSRYTFTASGRTAFDIYLPKLAHDNDNQFDALYAEEGGVNINKLETLPPEPEAFLSLLDGVALTSPYHSEGSTDAVFESLQYL